MEQGYRSGAGKPGCEGVPGDTRRSCLWNGKRGHAQVHLAVRSGGSMDRCAAQCGILRLRRQLSHRCKVRRHHRCRGIARHSPGEVGAARTMIARTEACFGLKPRWLAADSAYGSATNLDWLVNE